MECMNFEHLAIFQNAGLTALEQGHLIAAELIAKEDIVGATAQFQVRKRKKK